MWLVVIVVVVLGAWYVMQPGSSSTYTAPTTALGTQGSAGQTNTGQARVKPVLSVMRDANLGDYLVASNGMTLYMFTKDKVGTTTCYGACATNWPPYLHTVAEPLLPDVGVTGAITAITRVGGGDQISYKGIPLYFWKNDTKAGDTTGQNVGGVWFIVKP